MAGRFAGFWAANGSGKTTLFRLILGFLNAQNGTITLNQSYQPNQPSQLNKAHQVRQSCQNIALHAMSAHKRSSYISYMPQFIETPFDYKVRYFGMIGALGVLY
ncbi:ABC transporter ATP-binding protein [Helicobacter fennelliae]|uniref:ABC transporter ATP-binding protein n=1 Tax=Helicobacter fennelliae TaxID=215 RepID=A0A2X3GGY5_9HELI|nr:ATP-binding cassette domain-containing protein [Helicobacter fennelliae]SQC36199.1 ABC transporter ATP-binding protein [Helicobacter fennelliae]